MGAAVAGQRRAAQHRTTVLAVSPQATAEQRRKQITVLSADLARFAEMTEGADAEEVREMLDALWQRVDLCVEAHGGTIERHVGA